MKRGDIIEITKHIVGGKKNAYANPLDLVQIISADHLPVLLVHQYGNPNNTFPVHVETVTTQLHPKNVERLNREKKIKEKQNGN